MLTPEQKKAQQNQIDKIMTQLEKAIKTDRGINRDNIVRLSYDRIPSEERDPELHYYGIRHEDECGMTPCQIGRSIWANHWGDIATKKPLADIDKALGVLLLTKAESIFIYNMNPA